MKTCAECGNDWEETDTTRMYYFRSASKAVGSYTSPAEIHGLGENILFCPKCVTGSLNRVTREFGDLKPGTGNPRGRYDEEGDRERASQGKANVVHRPIL